MIDLLPKLQVKGMKMELAVDVVFINNKVFFHTLDRKIKCPHSVVLGTRAKGQAYSKEVLLAGFNHILKKYNKADVIINFTRIISSKVLWKS